MEHSFTQIVSEKHSDCDAAEKFRQVEQIHARFVAVENRDGRSDSAVRLVLQLSKVATVDVDAAVNGTGLFFSILQSNSQLVAQLLEDGLVQPDTFRLGLRVNTLGQPISANGSV